MHLSYCWALMMSKRTNFGIPNEFWSIACRYKQWRFYTKQTEQGSCRSFGSFHTWVCALTLSQTHIQKRKQAGSVKGPPGVSVEAWWALLCGLWKHFTCIHWSQLCRSRHFSWVAAYGDAVGAGHSVITVCTCVCLGSTCVIRLEIV